MDHSGDIMIWPTIAIAAVISSGCHAANTFSAKVELDHTTYVGTRLSNEVDEFIGIRYAEAPLGDLRFRAPQPPKQQPDVQRATSVSCDICPPRFTGNHFTDTSIDD
jgi:hypothetical protein